MSDEDPLIDPDDIDTDAPDATVTAMAGAAAMSGSDPEDSLARVLSPVIDELESEIHDSADLLDVTDAARAAGAVIAHLITEYTAADEDIDGLIDYIDDAASRIAARTGTAKRKIAPPIMEHVNQVVVERAIETIDVDEIRLDDDEGIEFDVYLEEHIEAVKRQETTDYTDDQHHTLIFEGGDAVAELKDREHESPPDFVEKVKDATTKRVRDVFLTANIADELPEGVSEDQREEILKELSPGPTDRMWTDWDLSMSHLIKDSDILEKSVIPGPRTTAVESLLGRVETGTRATTSLEDACAAPAIFVDEDDDEIWVPVTIVDAAVAADNIENQEVVFELSERGISTDALPGDRTSDAVTAGGTSRRFWRLDATHPEVKKPKDIEPSISTGAGALLGGGATAVGTDGGEPLPDDDDADEDADDGGDDDE